MSNTNLFDAFNPVSAKEWKQKIQFDLKGADYNETLIWESLEGIKLKPFYHADETNEKAIPTNNSGWSIGQVLYAGNAALANKKAKSMLQMGVESFHFAIPSNRIKIEELLAGISIEKLPIYFDFQFLDSDYIKSILQFVGDKKDTIHLNIDLLDNLGRRGNWYKNLKDDHEQLDTILKLNVPNTIAVDMHHYQNAGANMVQQLGYALAHGNEYLNHTQGKATNVTFKVAVGTNYFFEIAKLRALRLLWQTLASEYGVALDCNIIATPTRRNKTLYDYNTNMLRTTTECMSAILGGANMVCNMSYDAIYHKENDFGNRIALNQLLLLKNESYFDKVNDASAGTYYIEEITSQLAEKALLLFKQIEKGGGFLKYLKENRIQKKIKESAAKEQKLFDDNEEVLVGTNQYVNTADKMKDTIELYPFVKKNTRKTVIVPIIEKRLAEAIEQNRLDDE